MTRRQAFTIVELLVSLALILFIMVILSEAFKAGLDSFRQLKAVGDLEERMRTATAQLRKDLAADHFEGRRKMSDPNFWLQPTREGFFRVIQIGRSVFEGDDDTASPGNHSFRAVNHRLHFTVKLRGNQQEKFFSTAVPAASPLPTLSTTFFNQARDSQFQETSLVYNGPWAEVAYFLVPTGTTAGTQTPLYSLYRAQLIVLADNRQVNWDNNGVPRSIGTLADYLGFSCEMTGSPANLFFNTPNDLANGKRALETDLLPRNGLQLRDIAPTDPIVSRSTLLMTDVISFDVQVLKRNWPEASNGFNNQLRPDFDDLPNVPTAGFAAIFDTTKAPPITPAGTFYYGQPDTVGATAATRDHYNVVAVQITLRVWDPKTEQARQITVVQDL